MFYIKFTYNYTFIWQIKSPWKVLQLLISGHIYSICMSQWVEGQGQINFHDETNKHMYFFSTHYEASKHYGMG